MNMDYTDMKLLRLLASARREMHTSELAEALGITEDEVCRRMANSQNLGLVENTDPTEQEPS